MSGNYGNLRRRTRDSSWQWLIMGMILGIGAALVVCVGGYAVGAITFPALEAETSTPRVQIEPNQTEVSALATAANQTLEAQQAPLATEAVGEETEESTPIPSENGPETTNTPQASPLPDNTAASEPQLTPSQTTDGAAVGGQASGTEEAVESAGLVQDTPAVGTQPVGMPTQTITFAGDETIPAELQAIMSPVETVSGGTFMMGTTLEEGSQAIDECALYEATGCDISMIQDSTPAHQITADTFQMEIYEVSVSQYVAFLNFLGPNTHKSMCQGQPCVMTVTDEPTSYVEFDGTTYSVRNPEFYSNHPVTWVTWWGAQEYCRRIGRRLPTEAEWERAARGTQNFIYPWGFEYELTLANSSRPAAEGTEPVNSYEAGRTTSGIYNMAGNVEEWVSDWYQINYYSQTEAANPKGPTTGTEKVLRGGSWDSVPLFLRSVHRRSQNPGQSSAAIGFRCADDGSSTNVTPPTGPVESGTEDTGDAVPGGAPTLAPAATSIPEATSLPAGPTPTIDPGQ